MHEESDDSSDDLPPVGNGIYSVLMKLERDMPQLIPMHGKRIRIYYRGIIKRCTNCFGAHQRKNCKEEKVPWKMYVQQFINNYPEIPKEFYGRWANVIDGDRMVRPEQGSQSLTSVGMGDRMVRPEQGSQSLTSVGMNSQQEMSKYSKQTPKENTSEMGKEDEQEAVGENKSKTVEEAEKEELYQAIQSMVASGMSIKSIEEFFLSGKTETKKSLKGLKLGRGRGRGIGSGKGRGRGT
jgi:hypothetical protein